MTGTCDSLHTIMLAQRDDAVVYIQRAAVDVSPSHVPVCNSITFTRVNAQANSAAVNLKPGGTHGRETVRQSTMSKFSR